MIWVGRIWVPGLSRHLVHKDSFNLQSHKTKHLVQHLRRLLGHRCHSALLVHEGNLDINDNCRSWVKPAWDQVGWPLEQRPSEFPHLQRHSILTGSV